MNSSYLFMWKVWWRWAEIKEHILELLNIIFLPRKTHELMRSQNKQFKLSLQMQSLCCFQVSDESVHVICMIRCSRDDNNFRWPEQDDILEYPLSDVICTLDAPDPNGNICREQAVLSFSKEMLEKVYSSMREKYHWP